MAENTHPNKPILPNEAIAAGIKNTPAPIMLPTTNEVLVHKPNLFFAGADVGMVIMFQDDKIGFLLNMNRNIIKWYRL